MQTGFELNRRAMLGGLAAAAFAGAAHARGAAPGFGAVEALLDDYVAKGRVPGAIVAIVRPGGFRPEYLSAGKTAFSDGVAVTPDTLWRVYSMTKPITAMAVMQQVAKGALRLDQPIAEVLPEFKAMRVLLDPAKDLQSRPATTPITVRHLLTHTAGLSYSIVGNGPLEREYHRLGLLPGTGTAFRAPGDGALPDLDGFVATLATLPLHAEPGTLWRYSVALDLAGGLLQRLTGKPFEAVLKAQLFGPLGMASTGFSVEPKDLPRLSTNYGWTTLDLKPLDKPVVIDGPAKTDWLGPQRLPSGGGGLLASASDYARFGQMLLNDGLFEGKAILPRGAARAAMTNLMPAGVFFEKTQGFGAGGRVTLFDTLGAADGTPAGAYGWRGAAGTLFQVDPVRQVAVAVMLQFMPSQRWPLGKEFQTAFNRDVAA